MFGLEDDYHEKMLRQKGRADRAETALRHIGIGRTQAMDFHAAWVTKLQAMSKDEFAEEVARDVASHVEPMLAAVADNIGGQAWVIAREIGLAAGEAAKKAWEE